MIKRSISTSLVIMLFSSLADAAKPEVYSPLFGGAIGGYDPVAYFTQETATKGKNAHSLEYKEATWYFDSAENKAAFEQNPEKYAPQYGGYCAYAVSQGNLVSTDPEMWSIVDNKLYLNYSKEVKEIWEKDIPGYILKADAEWPEILH